MRVVIAGGGVIGCSIAWHVQKAGGGAILLERGEIAGEATGASAGMLIALLLVHSLLALVLRGRIQETYDGMGAGTEVVALDVLMLRPSGDVAKFWDDYATAKAQRRKTVAEYIKRIERLEELANSMPGVEQSYAIQAGREIRVITHSREVDDARADLLAADLAAKIQTEMDYPGKIKITVIRETRASATAR